MAVGQPPKREPFGDAGQVSKPGAGLELQVADEVSRRFSLLPWRVQAQPLIGMLQPDLLIQTPEDKTVLVELKLGKGAAHIGELAQVAAYKAAYEQLKPDHTATAFYVTSRELGDGFREAASKLGVQVVQVAAQDSPEAISSKLQQSVEELANARTAQGA